jgi:hypothetical protein
LFDFTPYGKIEVSKKGGRHIVFRKIISHLPFSPALIVELSEYAKKIRREEKLRIIGSIIVIALVALQIIITIYPPNSHDTAQLSNRLSPSINTEELAVSISSTNITQGNVKASTVKAQPGDKITYHLTLQGNQSDSKLATFAVSISDLLEYASLSDTNSGEFDQNSGILYWEPVEISPGETQVRSFSALIKSPISPNPVSNGQSYDCAVEIVFANHKNASAIQCPLIKTVETITSSLPKTNNLTSLWIGIILLSVVLYLLARARQLRHEVKIIRHDINTGGTL